MTVNAGPDLTIRDTIARDLLDEPQSVIKVYEADRLRTDLLEYVLTDQLAREFAKVLERVIDGARAGARGTDKVGFWVSGFFGSGKSHFAKLVGHLLADTTVGQDTARGLFRSLLHPGRPADERLRELLHEAATHRIAPHLVAFDIQALHSALADRNVGITFLRALYRSLGLSDLITFAEIELELKAAGRYLDFLALYQSKRSGPWEADRNLAVRSGLVARCLFELLPERYESSDAALQSIRLAMSQVERDLTVEGVVDRLSRWLDPSPAGTNRPAGQVVFVADEVGVWASSDINRIEQLRTFVETIDVKARGRIWLVATSQEKLSAVVNNAPTIDPRKAADLLERLEARFQTNIHLESSEVGSVIEERILRKKPTARPALERLWTDRQQQLRDIADPPNLDVGGKYARADREPFVGDYPFLPYQLQAAADIFGGMRGVKVSSGARSMIRVVFDATRALADRPLGTVVSWDQIFDSANRDNEFADEQYLGSQGLAYLASADRNVADAPIASPSRLLKVLWIVQQTKRIPRTPANLARLLVTDLDQDLMKLEADVAATLEALADADYVRQEPATGQWRFLTQDEVTVEKIVRAIGQDIRQKELRDEGFKLYQDHLEREYTGQIRVGRTSTVFRHGLSLDGIALKNNDAAVGLRVARPSTTAADEAVARREINLNEPVVYWVLGPARGLDERLRRAMAIERLESDERFRQIATERTRIEANNLVKEATQLRGEAESEVAGTFRAGTLYYAGDAATVDESTNGALGGKRQTAKSRVEAALVERIKNTYHRFEEGDRAFEARNVDRLLTAAPGERNALDPNLGLFSADGHVNGSHVLVDELSRYLKSSVRTAGGDAQAHFATVPFGWQPDLPRYVAAAMFVDGKLTLVDSAGKRYDDPRAAAARTLLGTAAFRTARLEVEEDALTPDESDRARRLLADLGHRPADGGEVALKEAVLLLVNDLTKRDGVVKAANDGGFPLPDEYNSIAMTLEEIGGAGSRVKIVRALLGKEAELRRADLALTQLEGFARTGGFAQFQRSEALLAASISAGLPDDPIHGEAVERAIAEGVALKEQKRVLAEWTGAYETYRLAIITAFRAAYTPLREELSRRTKEANAAIRAMPEFTKLSLDGSRTIRVEYLNPGRPLHEVTVPALTSDADLLKANGEFTIQHLGSALAALDSQVSLARARVIEIFNREQVDVPKRRPIVTWKASTALGGQQYATEADVDRALDAAKGDLKKLVREGKTVQVV